MKTFFSILLVIFLWGNLLFAEDSPAPMVPNHIIFGECNSVILASSVSVNYEYVLARFISVRCGYSGGYATVEPSHGGFGIAGGHGALAMINLFTTKRANKLELGGGVTYTTFHRFGWQAHPAMSLSYRYQQKDDIFFRAGLNIGVFGGLMLSVGCAF